jgi:hypothetical protein
MTSTEDYLSVLLIGHLAYGLVIGLVGALYGIWRKADH